MISKTELMNNYRESAIVGTDMDNHWKQIHSGRHSTHKDSLVFYKDMRFWLILLMLAAFFIFTLMRFP
jgi:hypothetical protein